MCLLVPVVSFAQTYSIDWHKISGGAGAILGKAMTGLSGGKGMVLVLVTLQQRPIRVLNCKPSY